MALPTVEPTRIHASALVDAIAAGEIVLPEFQRDFDWTERDVRSLLATILMGWPSGSLLLMRGAPEFFRVRPFEDAPKISKSVQYVVLDGQQRLTSLYHALHDRGPFVYALNFEQVDINDIDSIEEAVVPFRREEWAATLKKASDQRAANLVPFYVMRTASDFFEWRDSSTRAGMKSGKSTTRLSELYRDLLSKVAGYEFPGVIVERSYQPSAIARIFERLNKTGLRLGAFDLMVARSYGSSWNLRTEWENVQNEFPRLKYFLGDDGMPLLQTIALVHSLNVRQAAVLQLDPDIVREKWHAAASAFDSAAAFVGTHCGVFDPDMVPYRGMLVVLSGLALSGAKLPKSAGPLRKWFWDRAFNLAFDVGSNTKVVADFKDLRAVIDDDAELKTTEVNGALITEATRRGMGAVWKAFVCALADRSRKGDVFGVPWSDRSSDGDESFTGVITSVFSPTLKVPEAGAPLHLRALGNVLASPLTARRIRAEGFAAALDEAVAQHGTKRVNGALQDQFMPQLPAVRTSSPEDVIRHRLTALSKFLRVETGKPVVFPKP